MLKPIMVLPEPDSPTIATRSPGLIVKLIPRTTAEYPTGVGKLMTKFLISIALVAELITEIPAYFSNALAHLSLHLKDWQ